MNRLPLYLFAAAASVGWASAAARADHASLSLRAGGVAISLAATGGAEPVEADDEVAPEDAHDLAADHDPFIPDVYPSREDAARAAGAQWARQSAARLRRPPARVRVMCDDAALFGPVLTGLRARLSDVPVDSCDGTLCGGTPAAGEAWLYVTLSRGAVSIRSAGATDSAATTRFVDKPWESNFAGFTARTPGRWVVARSDAQRPAASAADAAREARLAAVDDVVPLVTARLRDGRRLDRGDVRRWVEAQLLGDRMVHDRFPQKYERPYGSLYREAVLVDASDARLNVLARELRRSLESERRSRVGGLASAGAILLVTYALYRFANAFTRGYFTWSLRTTAAFIAAGAVTLLLAAA